MGMTLIKSLLSILGRCTHRRHSWPQTIKIGDDKKTTVACLDCGKRVPYDWAGLGKEGKINPPRLTAPRRTILDKPGKYDLSSTAAAGAEK
jgi:hypothetical protein